MIKKKRKTIGQRLKTYQEKRIANFLIRPEMLTELELKRTSDAKKEFDRGYQKGYNAARKLYEKLSNTKASPEDVVGFKSDYYDRCPRCGSLKRRGNSFCYNPVCEHGTEGENETDV